MNPLSLREICAKATKGPWRINPDAAFPGVWSGSLADEKELVASPLGDSPTVQANAQLIARFSPETALAVYEALEVIQKSCGELRYSQRKKFNDDHFSIVVCDRVLANCKSVLNLLDGRTEP